MTRCAFAVVALSLSGAVQGQLVCSIDAAASEELRVANAESTRLAAQSLPVLTELRDLIDSREWLPDVPMEDQMTAAESADFTELQQRQTALMIAQMNASRREKHIEVLLSLHDLAKRVANEGIEIPKQGSDEFDLLQVLISMREPLAMNIEELPAANDECSLEQAFLAEATRIVGEINANEATISEALAEVERLRQKYGEVSLDVMEDSDRRYFSQRVVPVLQSLQNKVAYSEDLARLSLIASISLRLLESQKNDQYENPNDVQAIGTTWQRWIAEGIVTADEAKASGVLGVINDLFPSDLVSDSESVLTPVPE